MATWTRPQVLQVELVLRKPDHTVAIILISSENSFMSMDRRRPRLHYGPRTSRPQFRYWITCCIVILFSIEVAADGSLIEAIKNNRNEEAAQIIASGPKLSEVDEDGNPILIVAAVRNSVFVKDLLELGADPAAANPNGFNALHCLSARMYIPDDPTYVSYREGFYKNAQLILETGIDLNSPTPQGWTPLMLAARAGADDMIRLLLKFDAEIEIVDASGKRALHHAVSTQKPAAVRALIEAGADVNAKDLTGRTPLMIASEDQKDPVLSASAARLLLHARAEPDATDDSGQTAMMKAVRAGNHRIQILLRSAEADESGVRGMNLFNAIEQGEAQAVEEILRVTDPNIQDEQKRTPLMIASQKGNLKIVELLLQRGANPNVEDQEGRTALMYASNFREGNPNPQIVKLLIESGAKINAKDPEGNSALSFAVETFSSIEARPLVKELLDAKADPKATYYQEPVLFIAIRKGDAAILELLIRAGADPNVSYEKRTPLGLAVHTKQPEIITVLLNHRAVDPEALLAADEILSRYKKQEAEVHKTLDKTARDCQFALRRTACEGDCPVYDLVLHCDGNGEYFGEKNVALSGMHHFRVEPARIQQLLKQALLLEFFKQTETDQFTTTDGGESILTIRIEGRSQTLTSRVAAGESLARLVDDTAQSNKWIVSQPGWVLANANPSVASAKNLIQAVRTDRVDLAEALLKIGCNPNTIDESGDSMLVIAARRGKLSMLSLLLKYGAWPDPQALIAAAEKDNTETVQHLLNYGISARGLSLHKLAKDGSGELVRVLVAAKADIHQKDENGNTPLLLAAGYRNYEMVEVLLRSGANPNLPNSNELTPLLASMSDWPYPYARWFSSNRDAVGITELLLTAGADVNRANSSKTALSIAVSRREYYLVQALTSRTQADQKTSLAIAKQQDFSEILQFFREN